jgi:hypothetical protein
MACDCQNKDITAEEAIECCLNQQGEPCAYATHIIIGNCNDVACDNFEPKRLIKSLVMSGLSCPRNRWKKKESNV